MSGGPAWVARNDADGIIIICKILNSSVSTGAGLQSLAYNSTGLQVAVKASNAASPTVYSTAGGTIEDITTLGAYAAPTSGKIRFKRWSDTYHPGIIELHLPVSWWAVSGADFIAVSILGVTDMVETDFTVALNAINPKVEKAPASTALSTATWTNTLATELGTTNTTVATNLDATLSSVKERTDNLPDEPAAVGDAMTLTGDYEPAKNAASQLSLDEVGLAVQDCATTAQLTTVAEDVDTIGIAVVELLTRIPSALFSGITSLADWLRRISRKDAGTAGMIAAEAEIDTGGTSTFSGVTDSLEAIADASAGGGGDALEETSQEILGIVEDIQTKVSSATITTTGYAAFNSSGVLQLKEGHTATLTFTSTTNNVVSDLTSARVYLSVREVSGTPMIQVQGTVLVATGLQSVQFAIDAASAKKLRKGKCLFDVVAVYGYDASLTPPYTGLEPFTGGNADVTRLELQL